MEDQKGTLSYLNLSFASMGFATNNCGKGPIDWERNKPVILYFQCQHGFGVTEVLSTGLLDTSHPENDGINKCYLPEDDELDLEFNPEMQYFDRALMTEEILRQCESKESCRAEIPLDSGALQ